MPRDAVPQEEARSSGMPLWLRLTLSMTVMLALVMIGAGFFIYHAASDIALETQQKTLTEAVQLTAKSAHDDSEVARLESERKIFAALEKQLGDDVAVSERKWPPSENVTTKQVR